MNKSKEWQKLVAITQLKYDVAANAMALIERQDQTLAAEFHQISESIKVRMRLTSAEPDLSVSERNKIKWRRLAEGQLVRLNQQRLELRVQLESKRRQLALAAGKRDVSLKIADQLRKENLKRLVEQDR